MQNVLAMRALLGYQIWIKIYQRAGERQIIHRSNFYHNVPMKFVLQDMNNSLIPKADLSPWQQQVCSGNIQYNVSFEQQRAEVLRTLKQASWTWTYLNLMWTDIHASELCFCSIHDAAMKIIHIKMFRCKSNLTF